MTQYGYDTNPINFEEGHLELVDTKALAELLGNEFKKRRREAEEDGNLNYGKTDLAKEIGMDDGTLGNYIAGIVKFPRSDAIYLIATYFAKRYGEAGRKRVLEAAGVWGE